MFSYPVTKEDLEMSNREMIDVVFLAAVVVILVGSFIYVNCFYEEPAEEEEGGEDGGEEGADEEATESAFDAYVDAKYIGAESSAPLCL